MKAASLRTATAHEGDMALANLFPWNHHVVEGVQLAQKSLGIDASQQSNIPDMLANELQLLNASRVAEARQEEIQNRRRLKPRRNAAGGGSEAIGQGSAATISNRGNEAGPSPSSGSRPATTSNWGGEAGPSSGSDSRPATTSNRGGEAGPSSSTRSPARGGRPPLYSGPSKSRNPPRSAAPSQALPLGPRSAAESWTSFQQSVAAELQSTPQEDAPRPFIVSESSMERLHTRLREDRAAETERGRRRTSRDRPSGSEQQLGR